MLHAGKVDAIEAIFKQYYKYICISGARYIRDKQVVEDLVQDLFYDLWKKRDRLNIKTSLSSYLRTAIRNRSLNFIKSQRIDFAEEDEIVNFKNDSADSQENMESSELEEYLHRSIDRLPEKCRIVFSLSRFEELSYKEIAEKLDISVKTVENQISKALKLLREDLKYFQNK